MRSFFIDSTSAAPAISVVAMSSRLSRLQSQIFFWDGSEMGRAGGGFDRESNESVISIRR